MFTCFNKILTKEGFEPILNSRIQLTNMVRYLYLNFTDFRRIFEHHVKLYFFTYYSIENYISYMSQNENCGDELILIAAMHLYNVNIEIIFNEEVYNNKNEKITNIKYTPKYTDNLLTLDNYKEENRGNWTLIKSDKFYSYKTPEKEGNLEVRYSNFNNILIYFTQNEKYTEESEIIEYINKNGDKFIGYKEEIVKIKKKD